MLTANVFSFGSKREKASAILLGAFIAASNGDFVQAKRLISSDLFDLISVSDVILQIQYNRALAMVGVAAFMNGEVVDCYNLLSDLCTSGRLRELLAQGVSRPAQDKVTPEAEKAAEKRRLLPFHIHMNIELIESAYNLSAMILEISNLSQGLLMNAAAGTRRLAKYKRQIESYDRQLYSGPPESAKDSVVLAGKAILNDDIAKAISLIDGMKIWESTPPVSKNKIMSLVRVAALETYLLNNLASHKSFDLSELVNVFGLSKERVHACICRLVISGQIQGKINHSLNLLVLTVGTQSKVQASTQVLTEHVDRLQAVGSAPSTPSAIDGIADTAEDSVSSKVVAEILASLAVTSDLGGRRIRGARVGPSHSKGIAELQVAAEKRLQATLAKRRGWDNARGAQPLQGTVISTERKRLFDRSYGY